MERSVFSLDRNFEYLYAIVQALPRGWRPPGDGVGGVPVLAVPVRDVVLIAGRFTGPLRRTPLTQAIHADVVDVAARAQAILPMPFGTVLPDAHLVPWLCARLPRVREGLSRVRGSAEMQVRLVSLDGRSRNFEALAQRVVEAAGLPTWSYRQAPRLGAASVAFLVPRREVSAFLGRIAPIASRAEDVAIVPSGPLPPYSFTPCLEPADAPAPVLAAS